MALFQYHALTEEGKKISGVIDADSFLLAKERLRKQKMMVTRLSSVNKDKKEIILSPSFLLAFTRELGQLLRAGLPLYESLLTIEEKHRRHKVHPLFLDLCDRLKGGSSLSTALKRYPKSFNEVYLSMVMAAEQSGSLPQVFEQLTLLISRQQKLKKELVSALAYPSFLGCFCLVVVCGLLFFVIPSMQELFEGRSLHPLTQIVLAVSKMANQYYHIILIGLVALSAAVFVLITRPQGRIYLQRLCLKIPFFKTVIIQSALVRFCRSASVLLSGGVPLIQSLALSRKVMNNLLLEEVIINAEKRIVEGKSLSDQFRQSNLIPSLVVRMLAIAEETGKMGPMFYNIADIYEEEVEKHIAQMTTFLQPMLLLMLGAIVGVVILSILLPLTDVSSFLSS